MNFNNNEFTLLSNEQTFESQQIDVIKKIGNSSMISIVIFLAAILILFSILAPNFMTPNNVLNVLRQVSMIGIAGCGMITVLLTGGIDLSIGAMVTFINIVCAMMMVNAGVNPVLASILGIIIATLLGTINGFLISYCKLIPSLRSQYKACKDGSLYDVRILYGNCIYNMAFKSEFRTAYYRYGL